MFTRHLLNLLILLSALALSSCGGNEDDPAPALPHRTVLVYMIADNSLGSNGNDTQDLDEMRRAVEAGDLQGGRLLVYYNRPGTDSGNAPQLIEITEKEGDVVIKTYPDDPEIYSADPARLREAIADAKAAAPASDYGLVLWSHANGFLEGYSSADADRYYAFGDDRGRYMTLPSLAAALSGHHFSFIYFDCCLMGSVEVAYELRSVTDEIVASPTELHIDGMPYDANIRPLFSPGKPQTVRAATNTYEHYDARTGSNRVCQMTVLATAPLDDLAAASRPIYALLDEPPVYTYALQRYALLDRMRVCHSYDMRQYFERITGTEHTDLMERWLEAFGRTVIYAATTPKGIGGLDINIYSGLGVYVITEPGMHTYRGYNRCAWWLDVASATPFCRP